MPFIQQNVEFSGSRNSVVDCSSLGTIDFSLWKVRSAPTVAPTTQTNTDKPATTVKPTAEPIDGPDNTGGVSHAEVACRLADRRTKLVICGGSDNPWTDDHVRALLDWMKKKNGVSSKSLLKFKTKLFIVPTTR